MAYMRDSARPFPLMCIHAAVAAFAAFSFHVITASAAAAVPGHSPRSDKHSPMFLAICLFITPPRDTLVVSTPSLLDHTGLLGAAHGAPVLADRLERSIDRSHCRRRGHVHQRGSDSSIGDATACPVADRRRACQTAVAHRSIDLRRRPVLTLSYPFCEIPGWCCELSGITVQREIGCPYLRTSERC